MKNLKKLLAALLIAVMGLTIAIPAMAAAPAIERVEYEGSGKVEVEFTRENVRYKSAKVRVMDEDGKEYSAKIREKDREDLTFKVSDIKAGKKYAFQLSGVRAGTSGSYGTVIGYFEVPSAKAVAIKEVDYDHEDREMEIEFKNRVEYKSVKVRVKDEAGKSYSVKVRDKDSDSIEVRVSGLKYGTKYAVQVSGVRADGSDGDYEAVVKVFTAR